MEISLKPIRTVHICISLSSNINISPLNPLKYIIRLNFARATMRWMRKRYRQWNSFTISATVTFFIHHLVFSAAVYNKALGSQHIWVIRLSAYPHWAQNYCIWKLKIHLHKYRHQSIYKIWNFSERTLGAKTYNLKSDMWIFNQDFQYHQVNTNKRKRRTNPI